MPKVVITHNVVDVDKWLQFKSERADAIGSLGGRNVVDHVMEDGSTTVAVAVEVDDVAAMMATLSAPPPEMGAIMAEHGVVPPCRSTSRSSAVNPPLRRCRRRR